MTDASDPAPLDARGLLWQAREALLEAPAWQDYLRDVYAIDPGGYPFLTYVGLNFTKDSIKNYKFYFSFFRRLTEDEIQKLLPVPNRGRFDELYAQWHPTHRYETIHRGTTFALKVDADGTLTHYYHLRLPNLPFGLPERMPLSPADHGNYHGACEEFTADRIQLKRYYYCRDRATIAASLHRAGLTAAEDALPSVEWLEYIESDGRDKFDWITGHPLLARTLIEERGPPRLDSALLKLCRDCGFDLFGPGSATDAADHSLYFIEPAGPLNAGGYIFDGVRRFMQRYLQLEGW